MRSFALILCAALAAGCEDDPAVPPDAAAQQAECRALFEHIFQISPPPGAPAGTRGETDPGRIAARVASLPVEDFAQCAAIAVKDRSVIACMQRAPDPAALRACIPAKKDGE